MSNRESQDSEARAVSRVLDRYLQRLHAAIVRSPLLNAPVTTLGRGQRLDLTHLNWFKRGMPERIVDQLIKRQRAEVRPDFAVEVEDEEEREQTVAKLFRQMEKYLIREAEKIRRETGSRSLWLAYPLISINDPSDRDRSILAPVLLWPIEAKVDPSRQWLIRLGVDAQSEVPIVNKVMTAWVKSRLGVEIQATGMGERMPTDRASLREWLTCLLGGLDGLRPIDLAGPLSVAKRPATVQAPTVHNAGVIGVMRWQNQSLMTDLEELLRLDGFHEPFADFPLGRNMPSVQVPVLSEGDRHHVTPADYSQERAIATARAQRGCVLHGPPGTGKSQTITNMVADAIAHGEAVLVVCQKRAAIDVVSQRLKAVGLDEMCIVVHDVVSDREPVIDLLKQQVNDLRNALGFPGQHHLHQRHKLCDEIERIERQLDQAHEAYHRQQPCGLSYRDILDRSIGVERQYGAAIRPDNTIVELCRAFRVSDLDQLMDSIRRLAILYAETRPDLNPWVHRASGLLLTPDACRAAEESVESCRAADAAHKAYCETHGAGFCIRLPVDVFQAQCERLAEAISAITTAPASGEIIRTLQHILTDSHAQRCVKALQDAVDAAKAAPIDSSLHEALPPTTSDQDRGMVRQLNCALGYQGKWLRQLSATYRQEKRLLNPQLVGAGLKWEWHSLRRLKATLTGRIAARRLADLLSACLGAQVASFDGQLIELAATVLDWIARWNELLERAQEFGAAPNIERIVSGGQIAELRQWERDLRITSARCEHVQQFEGAVDTLSPFLVQTYTDALLSSVCDGGGVDQQLSLILRFLPKLDELSTFELEHDDLLPERRTVFDHLVVNHPQREQSGDRLADQWVGVVSKSTLQAWLHDARAHEPVLQAMSPEQLSVSEMRRALKANIEAKLQLEPKALRDLWRSRIDGVGDGAWRRLLVKRGAGAKRLREVVNGGLPLGLLKLRPCWLTNPDAASQLFELHAGMFDLVIFDEASQLPLEQAMPAIYRAKRVVVAGDEHQLPPTSFFQTAISDDSADATDDLDETDAPAVSATAHSNRSGAQLALECTDLLDLSGRILPECMLNVHYRSRHPALIAFSNWAFYHGRLEAAHPAWGSRSADASPIRIHRVDGAYDGQTNRSEAEHVVQMLDQLWSMPGEPPTVGVVTFNQKQEDLIDQLVRKRADENHHFRALWERELVRTHGQQDVGFFIKNVESVQGDERDLIIFSTTFGPTSPGDPSTFRRYFGPLTQAGGERRLNVAVTRAREGIIIVTSMPFDRISDLTCGMLPGREIRARDYLHAYMSYAEAVAESRLEQANHWLDTAALLASSQRATSSVTAAIPVFDSELERQVYERLTKAGWAVETQVGEAGFRIDLAVRHPEAGKGYLLGIECDGATYHSGWTARTRDVWRESILRECGWDIFRIGSQRWWTRQDDVMTELLAYLADRSRSVREPDGCRWKLSVLAGRVTVAEHTRPVAAELACEPPRTDHGASSRHAAVKRPEPRSSENDHTMPLFSMPEAATTGESLAPFAEEASRWAERLQSLWSDRLGEGEVGSWSDLAGIVYRLLIERQRGSYYLRIKSGADVLQNVCLPTGIPCSVDLSRTLRGVTCHQDVVDWFRRCRHILYPDE